MSNLESMEGEEVDFSDGLMDDVSGGIAENSMHDESVDMISNFERGKNNEKGTKCIKNDFIQMCQCKCSTTVGYGT